jgi:hypothetical protein
MENDFVEWEEQSAHVLDPVTVASECLRRRIRAATVRGDVDGLDPGRVRLDHEAAEPRILPDPFHASTVRV